jgi:hypothetical protein
MSLSKRYSLFAFLAFLSLGLSAVPAVSPSTGPCPWTIVKTATFNGLPVTNLTLAPGEQVLVNYSIVVDVSTTTGCVSGASYVEVFDDNLIGSGNPTGKIGEVWFGTDTLPKTFTYSKVIGPYNTCGEYCVVNTARLCSGASTNWTITIHVPCETGCTLTPGYWKTHSELGPAPYDDTWAQLPQGADTPFYLSGQTWYDVFWTPPAGGNAYYIFAQAYMAAKLNILNGASTTPAVDAAITWAENFFNSFAPTAGLSKSVRNQVLAQATLLDNYNNGLIGPGHCSE